MERVLTYSLGENLIEKIADFICENFADEKNDFSKVACVFGGRRPSLFLRRSLVKRIKKSFYPPRVFTIDEFVQYIIAQNAALKKIGDLDVSYLIYQLAQINAASILKGREHFSDFLPWAREIHSFIEQVDLEDIDESNLLHIEKSAAIGYDVPQNINALLNHVIAIRCAYHRYLAKENAYSRGRMYLEASKLVGKKTLDEFDAVIFCNFFYLHKTELRIMKEVYRKGKGIFIFQGSSADWSVLSKDSQELGICINPKKELTPRREFLLYQGFDMHSQVCLVREILNKVDNKENTVIVVPRSENIIPLLSEISSTLSEYNVSMGYPLKRSSLYALFDALLKAQSSKKGDKYYAKDYLNLIRHPLAKNLRLASESVITRIMVHKIEELLQGEEESSIGGSLFISLAEIEREDRIYSLTAQTLQNMDISVEIDECKAALCKLHDLFFKAWEKNENLKEFAQSLGVLLDVLVKESILTKFPLSFKVIEKMQDIKLELESLSFKEEKFEHIEIWEIFQQKLETEAISFIGSPLKGVQILGLFETRSLCFENVIIMDMNESVLPKLKIYEPLIPREVMLNLGLNRLEKEEEIQRYQFNSLISGAKNIHLIYEKNEEKEKSRFIEELLWNIQKEKKSLDVINVPRASFSINVMPQAAFVKKTAEMIEFMKRNRYSSSRINTYLNCPLQFYYQYVLGLQEKEDLLDEPQAPHIGNFIHELLEETFSKFKGKKPLIDKKFQEYFFNRMDEKFTSDLARRMKTDSFLLKKIIINRLQRFLDSERERNVAKIICLEEKRKDTVIINGDNIEFVYTVDRIDQFQDESIVIIDYKTGGSNVSPKKLSALLDMKMDVVSIKENIRSFQLPIYYHFVSKEFPDKEVNAELYNVRILERKAFISESDLSHKSRIVEICFKALSAVFSEIFDPDVPFVPEKEERRCSFCGFKALCR